LSDARRRKARLVTFVGITERRRNEQQVAEQTAALAEVARFPEMNPGPVLRLDLDGNVLLANGAAREVFGGDVVGSCWHDLCPDIDEAWPVVLEATTAVPLERQLHDRDYVFTHRHDVESGLVFVFGADISQQKQAERALRQTEKMAALGKLSAGLAHELNNPAAAAGRAASQLDTRLDELQSTTIELARAGIEPDAWQSLVGRSLELREHSTDGRGLSPLEASDREEELGTWLDAHGVDDGWTMAPTFVEGGLGREDLESIAAALPSDQLGAALSWLCKALEVHALAVTVVRSSRAISDLVTVVKSYSRMDQAPVQHVDVHEGIEDTLTILGHRLRRGIDVVREYDRTLPRVLVPGNELNQVWTNLIDNALGAMGESGTLTIRTYREDEQVTVDIADDGPGIPEEIQPRIFDPFFTTKDVGEGTGLGLDVVRRIVLERCAGWIDFRSRPGETVFSVSVPVDSTPAEG
jgi:signal transduction histidine kinase